MKLEEFDIWVTRASGAYSATRYWLSHIETDENAKEEHHLYVFFDRMLDETALNDAVKKRFSGDYRSGCFLKCDFIGDHVYLKASAGIRFRFKEPAEIIPLAAQLMEDMDIDQARIFNIWKNEMTTLTRKKITMDGSCDKSGT